MSLPAYGTVQCYYLWCRMCVSLYSIRWLCFTLDPSPMLYGSKNPGDVKLRTTPNLERPMSTGKRRYFRSRLSRSTGIASLEKDLSPTFSQMFLAKTYMCLLGILTFGWRQTNVNRNIPLCRYVYNFCRCDLSTQRQIFV